MKTFSRKNKTLALAGKVLFAIPGAALLSMMVLTFVFFVWGILNAIVR